MTQSQIASIDYEEDYSNDSGPYFGYCYCNQQWGWFWAVWDDNTRLQLPLSFGFVASKALAKDKLNRFEYARFIDCGFTFLDTYYANLSDCNERAKEYIRFEWFWTFTSEVEKSSECLCDFNKPIWSRCGVGKDKWYWGAWESIYHYLNGDAPFKCGYKPSSVESVTSAIQAAGNLQHRGISPAYAQAYLRKLATIKRKNSASDKKSKSLNDPGFLYTSDYPFYFKEKKKWYRHRIIKKTQKSIYVERRPYQKNRPLTGEWFDYAIFSARLDRKTLEQDGVVRSRSMHKWFSTLEHRKHCSRNNDNQRKYYNSEKSSYEVNNSEVKKAVSFLGLQTPYTLQDLKNAFRSKVFSHHPDQGGDHHMFVKLKNSFDIALRNLESASCYN